MLLSKCEVCDSKKSKFNKTQEASGFLSCLEIKIPSIKIVLVGPLSLIVINKLVKGIKGMSYKKHLIQTAFTYSPWGPFTKNK